MWQCYYQMLSVLSSPKHPQLAWTLSNYCNWQKEFKEWRCTRALYCLCEMVGEACFESLFIWRWWKNTLFAWFLQSWAWAPEAMQHIWGRKSVRKGRWFSSLSLLSCKGGFLLRAPAVAGVAGYLVVVSKPLCSAVILACCHGFADRWEWHCTCTWDAEKWNFIGDTRDIYLPELSSCWISKACCKQWKHGNTKLKVKIRFFLSDEKYLASHGSLTKNI